MSLLSHCFPQVKARDADGGSFGSVAYSLGSGSGSLAPPHFTINKESGQICTSASLDRDQGPASYDFVVTAVDGVSQFNVIDQHQMCRLKCQATFILLL